jgi:hypothetical protein
LLPDRIEAMPLALEKDLGTKADDLVEKAQAVTGRPPGRPDGPSFAPPRRRGRRPPRRRWVCRWHRGRRVCGWRR